MKSNESMQFFNEQFRDQLAAGGHALYPFETAALPYLRGRVLDYGCGLGNLALEAARRGCSVVALDASHEAISQVRSIATRD
ncbi:MAG: methyltransferase domain-containing protein, partial [Microbacteriaceae bacterium]